MSERKSRYELFLEEEARKAQPTKRCTKCGEEKALGEYAKNKKHKDGAASECKACFNTRDRKYRDKVDRFWKLFHSRTVQVGDCLEWIGAYNKDKQIPMAHWNKKYCSVRRIVSYLAIDGVDISDNTYIVPSCGNNRCVRQSHTERVTKETYHARLNNKKAWGDRSGARIHPDRMWRGGENGAIFPSDKQVRGENNPQSKLTESKVRMILDMDASGVERQAIARQFNVSKSAISLIVRGKNWKHITENDTKIHYDRSCGEHHPCAKLTKSEVCQIRLLYMREKPPYRELAQRFGVSQSLVGLVIRGKIWAHVE